SGRTVTWSQSGAVGSFASGTSNTNANGVATVVFTTNTTIGTTTITATDGGLTGNTGVTSVAGTPTKWFVSTATPSPVAGTAITANAQLHDVNNNHSPTSGVTPTWRQAGAVGVFSAIGSTNASGLATVTFTTNTSVGSTTITGSGGGFT